MYIRKTNICSHWYLQEFRVFLQILKVLEHENLNIKDSCCSFCELQCLMLDFRSFYALVV